MYLIQEHLPKIVIFIIGFITIVQLLKVNKHTENLDEMGSRIKTAALDLNDKYALKY